MAFWERFQRRQTPQAPLELPPSGFQFRRGRRYKADDSYVLPADLQEIQRLDFQHFMFRNFLRGNILAPVRNPLSILDVGCGTGRWGMEVANAFQRANVIGLDMIDPQDTATVGLGLEQRPANYIFVQGNVLAGLPFVANAFDYVHQRIVFSSIPTARWPEVIQELLRVIRRFGWLELVEIGPPIHTGPYVAMLWNASIELNRRRGMDFTQIGNLGAIAQRLVRGPVLATTHMLPIGSHGARLGAMTAQNIIAIFRALAPAITGQQLIPPSDYDRVMTGAIAEMQDPSWVGTVPVYVVCAQQR